MIDTNNNTYDEGTITFEGTTTEGSFLQFNIYDIDYEGGYTVEDTVLTLTGDENWRAEIIDSDHISGTWSHDDEGFQGTVTAERIP